jgi:hypothetical protein
LGQRGSDERGGIALYLLHRIALRGWLALTTIAGRGRASSPVPEGALWFSFPLGRWQAGRDATLLVLNPPHSDRGPNRLLHSSELPRDGAGVVLPASSFGGSLGVRIHQFGVAFGSTGQ